MVYKSYDEYKNDPPPEPDYKNELIKRFDSEENLEDFFNEMGFEGFAEDDYLKMYPLHEHSLFYKKAHDWLEERQIITRSDYLSFWKKTVEEDQEVKALKSEVGKGYITKDRAKAELQSMITRQCPRTGWARLHYYFEAIDATPEPVVETSRTPIDTQDPNPAYIQYLIDKGYLYPDGRRIQKSLDDTACALVDYWNSENEITQKPNLVKAIFLKEIFRDESDAEYSDKTCKDAAILANQNYKTKKNYRKNPKST